MTRSRAGPIHGETDFPEEAIASAARDAHHASRSRWFRVSASRNRSRPRRIRVCTVATGIPSASEIFSGVISSK